MAGFDLALARVRDDATRLLAVDHINALARANDHTFRNTILTPGNTLCWFVRQIAHGNVACSAVHRLADEKFSDAAWCQARDRLPIELIQRVHRGLIESGAAGPGSAGRCRRCRLPLAWASAPCG